MRLVSLFNAAQLTEDPVVGNNGELYFNTASNSFRFYTSGSWVNLVSQLDPISKSIKEVYKIGSYETASVAFTLSQDFVDSILLVDSFEFADIILPRNDIENIPTGSSFKIIRGGGGGVVNVVEGGGVILAQPSSIFLTAAWNSANLIKIEEDIWLIDTEFPDLY